MAGSQNTVHQPVIYIVSVNTILVRNTAESVGSLIQNGGHQNLETIFLDLVHAK